MREHCSRDRSPRSPRKKYEMCSFVNLKLLKKDNIFFGKNWANYQSLNKLTVELLRAFGRRKYVFRNQIIEKKKWI